MSNGNEKSLNVAEKQEHRDRVLCGVIHGIHSLMKDDAYAATFQSVGQYRAALAKSLVLAVEAVPAKVSIGSVAGDVLAERQRQIEAEGWTPGHDDSHTLGELSAAAACYALDASGLLPRPEYWPFDHEAWKPRGARQNLVRAGALILAEIERLDRLEMKKSGT